MLQFHRWSELFIPTLREAPADATTSSHALLLRSGYLRQMAGAHSYLFLGQRCLSKIAKLIREEMDKIAQEFRLPASQDDEAWAILTDIAHRDLRSYKQLPQIWYTIGARYFGEPRNRLAPLRARQSLIATSCAFDTDAAGSLTSYKKHSDAYCHILTRCGITYQIAAAATAENVSSEAFVALTPAGDDVVVRCQQCGYAALRDSATAAIDPVPDLSTEGDETPRLVHTPGVKTIDDLAEFLHVSPKNNMKTLAYIVEDDAGKTKEEGGQAVVALLRGDHQLNEAKLSRALGGRRFRPMERAEIAAVFNAPAGFLGPLGLTIAPREGNGFGPGTVVLVDKALQGRHNLITGANKEDFHLKNVTPDKDFQPTTYIDLRTVSSGEPCSECGKTLSMDTVIHIATLCKSDPGCAEKWGARVLGHQGKEIPVSSGRYSMALEQILIAAIERNHDGDGFCLPPHIAPFEVIVTPISMRDDLAAAAANNIAQTLVNAGCDVLVDDRDERPGVKFKDADLVGIPFRINVGKKVTEGTVEVVNRSTRETRDASITAIAEYVKQLVRP